MSLLVAKLSAHVKLWNPVSVLAPFLLLAVSIPLAIFAIVTTSFAVSLLTFRAAVVYVQLAVALIGAWLSPPSPKSSAYLKTHASSHRRNVPSHHSDRSINSSSHGSSQSTITPVSGALRLNTKSGSTTLLASSDITRDYEGVGGWRMPGDEEEEALWIGMNSRLQLPTESTVRRHKRSFTGGSLDSHRRTRSPEAPRMSPAQSRARTPVRFSSEVNTDYFTIQPMSNIRPTSDGHEIGKEYKRRKSSSGSSTSSTVSGIMMAAKEGEKLSQNG